MNLLKKINKEYNNFQHKCLHDIQEKETLGSYQLNCLSKPQFILDRLNELNIETDKLSFFSNLITNREN